MERKSILMVGIIIVLFVVVAFVGFGQFGGTSPFSSQSTVKVGDVYFDMPQGFHEESSDGSSVKLNDGSHSIFIKQFNDSNINKHIDEYLKYANGKNVSVTRSNTTFGDFDIQKAVGNETGATYYWYNYNNKTYQLNTWGNYDKTESTFIGLMESMSTTDKTK